MRDANPVPGRRGMRLGVVSPHPPTTGTLTEYGQHLVAALGAKPEVADLVVLTDTLPAGTAFPAADGVRFREAWRFNDPLTATRIVRAARAEGVDALLFNVQFASFGDRRVPAALGLLAPLLARLAGIRTVVLLHNIMETVDLEVAGFGGSRVLAALTRLAGTVMTWLLLRADLVAVTMPQYVDVLRDRYGADNVALVPHGTFDVPLEADPAVPAGPAQLLAFGKFGTYKKVEPLVEAARVLRRQGHDVEVVVAGTDSPNAPGYLARVRAGTVGEPVRFTGYVAEEDVPAVFGEATVVVFPYEATTGSSGVVHQAASYARSLVMPDVGDFRRLVEAEGYVGGWFVPGDDAGLAAAIAPYLEGPDRREAEGRRNHAVAAGLPMADIADFHLEHLEAALADT